MILDEEYAQTLNYSSQVFIVAPLKVPEVPQAPYPSQSTLGGFPSCID